MKFRLRLWKKWILSAELAYPSNNKKLLKDQGSDDDSSMVDASEKTSKMENQSTVNTSEKNQNANSSEHEEGELSDSDEASQHDGSSSESNKGMSTSDSEFDDGYDENLMGDEEDRKRLNGLSEKERETEIYKRIEQRDRMRTRWEIERKLKLARRGETGSKEKENCRTKKPKKIKETQVNNVIRRSQSESPITTEKCDKNSSQDNNVANSDAGSDTENQAVAEKLQEPQDYFDHKERSKERKKNVEMNRTDDKRSNAMALLKAKREGKAKREEEEAKRQAAKEREEEKEEIASVSGGKPSIKLKASEIYSDDSGSDDSEDDKPVEKQDSSESSGKSGSESEEEQISEDKPIFLTTREELNKLRLSRFKMERFVNLPNFEQIVKNCFVRISIGNNGQKPVYRVAEVVSVVETAKIYTLGKTRTNKGLRLRHGTQERVFRLEFISNQDFTPNEYEKWREICTQQGVPMPTNDTLERKRRDIHSALNYEYKDEDVDKIVEEKKRLRNRPTNYAMRKTCLMKERDAAMLRGDYDEAQELGTQIEELESRASELDKKRSSSISLISYINDRNRKRNVQDAEKAIMEEARANKGLKISDPFTRRITQPRMGFKSLEKPEEPTNVQSKVPQIPAPEKDKSGDPKLAQNKTNSNNDYNLYSLHDFDIDLDVALPVSATSAAPQTISRTADTGPKRSLNLEDYKKKRGLI